MIDRLQDLLPERRPGSQRKLRRQPKMRRVDNSSRMRVPKLVVPQTAQKRRRRNRAAVRLPKAAIKQVVLSTRWISLFLMAACVAALFSVGMDERYYLTMIPVEGAASIPPPEIVDVSGLAGAHIFAADPGEAAERIASIPGVISATVKLQWPNSALVQIAEDTPIAIWEQGGMTYWVNADGALAPARVDVPGLLHIRADVDENQAPAPSEASEDGDDNAGTAGAEEAVSAPPMPFVADEVLEGAIALRELRPNIDILNYDVSGGLSFQDGRGWRVYFGAGGNMAEKLAVYEALVDDLLARQIAPVYVSVVNQEKPFYLARDS